MTSHSSSSHHPHRITRGITAHAPAGPPFPLPPARPPALRPLLPAPPARAPRRPPPARRGTRGVRVSAPRTKAPASIPRWAKALLELASAAGQRWRVTRCYRTAAAAAGSACSAVRLVWRRTDCGRAGSAVGGTSPHLGEDCRYLQQLERDELLALQPLHLRAARQVSAQGGGRGMSWGVDTVTLCQF